MPTLKIHLFGRFQLFYDGSLISAIHQSRQQSLLAYLLLHGHTPLNRQELAFRFWPDFPETQAFANLRKALHRLRQALPDLDQFLSIEAKTLRWRPEAVFTVDVIEFERYLAEARAAQQTGYYGQVSAALEAAVERYGGDLLPHCSEDWLLPERERLRQQFIQALEQLIRLYEEQRRYLVAIQAGQRLLRHDPLHETTYRHLMRLHLLNDDRPGALVLYHTCATRLQQELGVAPSPATQEIYERLLGKRASLIKPSTGVALSPSTAPLVGRQAEWQQLLVAWRRTSQGHNSFVLIAGEAGVGKTRLAEALLTWAGQQGLTTTRTRAYASTHSLAYGPIIGWLRTETFQSIWPDLDRVWLTEIARLLPELLAQKPGLPHPQPITESWQRNRLFEALAQTVLKAGQSPLLVLDDLQWCDPETLDWLDYLLRFKPQARLFIVGTVRIEEIGANQALTLLLRNLRQTNSVTEIELAPLDVVETAKLAEQVAEQPLEAEVIEQLYRDTEGNPLFIVEMVRAGQWSRSGLPRLSPGPAIVPPKIQAMIEGRLGQLSSAARELVNLAAVIGREFTFEVLVVASSSDEASLVSALDEAWQRRIFREQGQAAYDFSHDKIREIAYVNLSTARRRLWHRRVAQALESVYAGNLAEISSTLGEHYVQAGNWDKAREYFYLAAQRATSHFANSEALAYLSRTLELTPQANKQEQYTLLLARERLYRVQGAREGQHHDLATLQEIAEALADEAKQAEVALHWSYYGREIGDYPAAIAAARVAADLAQKNHLIHLEALTRQNWGFVLREQGEYPAARAQLDQALILAQEAQLPYVAAEALHELAAALFFSSGSHGEVKTYLEQALCLFQEIGNRRGESQTLNKLGYLIVEQGEEDYQQARTYYDEGLQISREIGHRIFERYLLANLGVLLDLQGNHAQAQAHLEQALLISREIGHPRGEGQTLNYLANASANQGDYPTAKAQYEQALHIQRKIGLRENEARTLSDFGLFFHRLGDDEAALQHYQLALRIAQDQGIRRFQGYTLTRLGQALTNLGRLDEAIDSYQEALAIQYELGQYNRSMEAQAGLARAYLAQNNLEQALTQVGEIFSRLDNLPGCGLVEPFRVYLTCYWVLQAKQDPRAWAILNTAHSLLQERAAKFKDNIRQRSYLENVATHQEILTEIAMAQTSSPAN